MLLSLQADDPPPASLSLVAGVALHEAVRAAAPAAPLALKWPNDLMLDGDKLAGILIERAEQRVVAGFGVNLASAPDLPDRRAAALSSHALLTPETFAPLLAAAFDRALADWRQGGVAGIAERWGALAHPVGTALRVMSDGVIVSGTFAGLAPDGALLLALPDGGVRTVLAGDVSVQPPLAPTPICA